MAGVSATLDVRCLGALRDGVQVYIRSQETGTKPLENIIKKLAEILAVSTGSRGTKVLCKMQIVLRKMNNFGVS